MRRRRWTSTALPSSPHAKKCRSSRINHAFHEPLLAALQTFPTQGVQAYGHAPAPVQSALLPSS